MLKVDIDSMRDELDRLDAAIEEFRPFAEDAFSDETALLEEMNSDFIPKLKKILNNMQDNASPQLLKKIELYHDMGEEIVDTLEKEVDHAIAIEMEVK